MMRGLANVSVWVTAACAVCLHAACAAEQPIDVWRAPTPVAGRTQAQAQAGRGGTGTGGAGTVPVEMLNPELVLTSSCATESQQASLLPANILFVIDRSGSMRCNPPPTTKSEVCEADSTRADPTMPSKWELTTESLLTAIETLPEATNVGVSYFSNDDACGVYSIPSVPLSRNTPAQRNTLRASLQAVQPKGATPLVGATILAYQHMHQAALAGELSGRQYVVLITDGQQSEQCSDASRCAGAAACTDLLVRSEVPRALAEGVNIRTFVVGVPGSESARSVLSQIAVAGGTAATNCSVAQGNCHFDMTREPELGTALQRALLRIGSQTLTCDLALPKPKQGTVDLKRVNVVFRPHEGPPKIIPQDNHAGCDAGADGWQYNATKDQIRLCGLSCTTVRSDHSGRIDVVLGCPVVGPD